MMRIAMLPFIIGISAGCHTMGAVAPSQLRASNPIRRVWVTAPDKTVVSFEDPEVNGDTLTGIVNGEPQRMALSDVVTMRARRVSAARTAVVALVAGGAAFAGMWYMEHRPDVGDARICTNGVLDMGVSPGSQYIPCCIIENTEPC